MDFEDARICKVVDAHTVSQADALVGDREVVVVVVSAKDGFESVRQARFKELVLLIAAEYAVGRHVVAGLIFLTHNAVVVGDFGRNDFAFCEFLVFDLAVLFDDLLPRVSVFNERNMEERHVLDRFIRSALCDVLCDEFVHLLRIPIHLRLMQVVVFPLNSEIVAVKIAVAVKHNECLRDDARAVFDLNDIVAAAVLVKAFLVGVFVIQGAAIEQAVFEVHAFIISDDILLVVRAVYLCVVVAERKRPIHAKALHHIREDLRCVQVVESTGLERNGVCYIARDDDKVRLLRSDHRCDSIHSPRVLLA